MTNTANLERAKACGAQDAVICKGCGALFWAEVDCDCGENAGFQRVFVTDAAQLDAYTAQIEAEQAVARDAPEVAKVLGAEPWQPIETAPKDGTQILLGRFTGDPKAKNEGVCRVDYYRLPEDRAGYIGFGRFNQTHWPATHWMRIQKPGITHSGTGGEVAAKIGDVVSFEGELFQVVCNGDRPNTFDLHVYPKNRPGDQWRNVPKSEVVPHGGGQGATGGEAAL